MSSKTFPFDDKTILRAHKGRATREDFLVLHYLRGNPASIPEPRVAPNNEPSAYALAGTLEPLLERPLADVEIEALRAWCKVEPERVAPRPKRKPRPRPEKPAKSAQRAAE